MRSKTIFFRICSCLHFNSSNLPALFPCFVFPSSAHCQNGNQMANNSSDLVELIRRFWRFPHPNSLSSNENKIQLKRGSNSTESPKTIYRVKIICSIRTAGFVVTVKQWQIQHFNFTLLCVNWLAEERDEIVRKRQWREGKNGVYSSFVGCDK